jgi:hypothetical protein
MVCANPKLFYLGLQEIHRNTYTIWDSECRHSLI